MLAAACQPCEDLREDRPRPTKLTEAQRGHCRIHSWEEWAEVCVTGASTRRSVNWSPLTKGLC